MEFELRGGTDITGFSLLGHADEMARAGGVRFRFEFAALPFVSGAQRYAQEFIFPGGAADNRLYFGGRVTFQTSLAESSQMLLFDPQTSGGLLLAVPQAKHAALLQRAAELNQPIWTVGEVLDGAGIEVV